MSDNACPVCASPRPANRAGDWPWCCSIACYRSFHGIEDAEGPSCHDGVTTTCPVCQPSGLREPAGHVRDHDPKPIRLVKAEVTTRHTTE